jgi:CspA family cold shock protein
MKGKVNWYNVKKGFGFIIPEDGTKDIFVHHSGITQDRKPKEILEGQDVEFEVTQNEKGRTAINLKVIEKIKQDIDRADY